MKTMNNKPKAKRYALLFTVVMLVACIVVVCAFACFHPSRVEIRSFSAIDVIRCPSPSRASQQHWQRRWTCSAGASLSGVPAAWSNGFVAATEKGEVVALDNAGCLLWRHACSNISFSGSPVVAGTSVVTVADDGDVMALNLLNGEILWQVKIEGSYRHGPLALRQNGTWQVVLLSAADGVLRCLDATDGRARWRTEPTNRSDGSPGFSGDSIAYGNCDSAVHVFSMTNGAHVAQIPVGTDAQMAGGTLVLGAWIYGGTRGGELVCVDVVSNGVAWRARVAGGEAFNTPVSAHDQVLMSSHDGRVTSFAARDGARQWDVALSNAVKSLCVVDDAVFAVAGGALVGMRLLDGGVFLKIPVGDDVEGPVWNGHLLVVVADGGNVIGVGGE